MLLFSDFANLYPLFWEMCLLTTAVDLLPQSVLLFHGSTFFFFSNLRHSCQSNILGKLGRGSMVYADVS